MTAAAGTAAAAEVELPRCSAAPRIDGVRGEDEWRAALPLELLHQTQPGDNVPPSEPTVALLCHADGALYLAFQAVDSQPSAIRARVTRRDDVFADDYVSIFLDTYDDRRRAYVFHFNPLGVQADGLYNEGETVGKDYDDNIDLSWDGLLQSKGTVGEHGYFVEAALPFASLRFPRGPGRTWGLHLRRVIARKAETVHWRPVSRESSSLLVQMGRLAGLPDARGERRFELIPTLTGSLTTEAQARGFRADGRGDPGLTASWSITPNLTLSGAANPDFSHIEADVPQIEVNQRFPLFFAEKRPFFLEGGQYFRSPGALTFVSTRQIVDPDWGLKLTAKSGRNTVAVLSAQDRAPGERQEPGRPGLGETARLNVVRYQRDVLQNSTVGGFLSDVRFAGSSNTVAALDGQVRARLHTVGFQLARSRTLDLQGRGFQGSATYVWYELQGRHWRVFVNDLRLAPDYRSETGFVRRTGIRSNSANFGYEFQADRPAWYQRIRPFVVVKRQRTVEGLLDESYIDPGADLRLARNVTLYVYHSFHTDSFGGREYGYDFDVADFTINPFRRLGFEGRVQRGEGVNFDPADAQVGRALDVRLGVNLKPDARLQSDFLYLKSRLQEAGTGRRLFDQDIYRNRTSYQATRFHAVRLISEYNSRTRRLSLSFLYGYTPRTNTAVYAGYGDLLLDGRDPVTGHPVNGWQRQRRAFLLKLSYGMRP